MSADVPGSNVLTEATGRQSVAEVLAWIADEHPLERGTDLHELLRAVATHSGSTAEAERALRILARAVAASNLDSAAILFDPETILPACRFRETLSRLATQCPGGTIAGITTDAVIAAQREDSFTIEALCVVAGLLSYRELTKRVKDLPKGTKLGIPNVPGPTPFFRIEANQRLGRSCPCGGSPLEGRGSPRGVRYERAGEPVY